MIPKLGQVISGTGLGDVGSIAWCAGVFGDTSGEDRKGNL